MLSDIIIKFILNSCFTKCANAQNKKSRLRKIQIKNNYTLAEIKISAGETKEDIEKLVRAFELYIECEIQLIEKVNKLILKILTEEIKVKEFKKIKTNENILFIGYDKNEIETLDLNTFANMLIIGNTGTGKTCFLRMLIENIKNQSWKKEIFVLELEKNDLEGLSNNYSEDLEKGVKTLEKIYSIMQNRKSLFKEKDIKNILDYNKKYKPISYIYLIIDEFSMYSLNKNEKGKIKELKENFADKLYCLSATGRSKGINIILATQRPSQEFINPSIRALMNNKVIFRTPYANAKLVSEEITKDVETLKNQEYLISNNGIKKIIVPNINYN